MVPARSGHQAKLVKLLELLLFIGKALGLVDVLENVHFADVRHPVGFHQTVWVLYGQATRAISIG